MIQAKIICDSMAEHSPRLTTFLLRYPKFIHAEHMRHRAGSYCVSSSRAIPVSRSLEEVRSDELRASPVFWGSEQKGMSSGEELPADNSWHDPVTGNYWKSSRNQAKDKWREAGLAAVSYAEQLQGIGVHKSIVNRVLEPFLHVNCLMTIAEPGLMNFFGLRLDRSAQPEIRALAEQMWREWRESVPIWLEPGQWHLPFVDERTNFEISAHQERLNVTQHLEWRIKISVARCARLSYTSFETSKRSTIDEDLELYNRLIEARPIHASPAEHQATPDHQAIDYTDMSNYKDNRVPMIWLHPELSGNLGPGWRQYRKMLPGEAIAPLSEGYEV